MRPQISRDRSRDIHLESLGNNLISIRHDFPPLLRNARVVTRVEGRGWRRRVERVEIMDKENKKKKVMRAAFCPRREFVPRGCGVLIFFWPVDRIEFFVKRCVADKTPPLSKRGFVFCLAPGIVRFLFAETIDIDRWLC